MLVVHALRRSSGPGTIQFYTYEFDTDGPLLWMIRVVR